MKLNKIKTTLLIAVLLLSTIVGLAVPAAMAATSVTAEYILLGDGASSTTYWSAEKDPLGLYSVELDVAANGWTALEITPPSGITIADLDDITSDWAFWYYTDDAYTDPSGPHGPLMELRFVGPLNTDPDGAWHVDITVDTAELGFTDGIWVEESIDSDSTAIYYGNFESGSFSNAASNPLSGIEALIEAEDDAVDVEGWELVRVRVEVGYHTAVRTFYIDDITIDDVDYELEPQSLTVGQAYDISWTTAESTAVDLDYTPETFTDIDLTETSNADGVVNFYNVIPSSAMNWKLSDLTGPADGPFDAPNTPEGTLDTNDLVKMICGNEAVYFSVQPVEDHDVVVSPSTLDVESGTVALSVTVTSDGEPVDDAYVSVEFWDNEAEEFYTLETAPLRGYETQTASNGMAMFDILVPEVAGTIYVTAGTDLGPELEGSIDGAYFEHWGYKTIPVDSVVGIKTVVSPTSFVEGVPHDLIITLDELLTGALLTADTGDAVTITITGEEIDTGSISGTSGITATNHIIDEGDLETGWPTSVEGVEEIVLMGKATASTIVITIEDFESITDADVYVSVESDIGGVDGKLIDITDADGLEDYFAAMKTISVEEAEAGSVYFVDLTEKIEAAKEKVISFTASYTHDSTTGPCNAWIVKLEYPTGHVYTGVTGGDGSFSKAITADQQGVVTITITHPEGTYGDTAEVPIKGFLISTDTLSFTVLEENTIAITVMNGTTPVNNAKVTLVTSQDPETLTTFEGMEIDGTVDYVEFGQYIFHAVESSVVATITATASKLVETVEVDYAQLTMKAVNNVLDISPSITELTALVENEFTVYVTEEGEPILDAVFELNLTEGSYEAISAGEDGYYDVTIDYDVLPEDITAVKMDVVNDVMTKTGSFTLPVGLPIYAPSEEFYLTAGIDSEGNFTVMSADGEEIILVESDDPVNKAAVYTEFNMTLTTATEFEIEYLWFKLLEDESCDTNFEKIPALEITAKTATGTDPESAVVKVLPIYNPIVSNTTYSGFPITYTADVGQSGNFYIKIQEAGGEPVEDAEIEIAGTLTSGLTDSDGETTITWTPPSTGTYDLLLNGELNIGTIKVESYTPPQLVIDYTPKPVYLNNLVTISVTADGEISPGIPVSIVDPDGITIERKTTGAGTCTFTANKLEAWDIWAYYSEDDYEYISIDVLEYEQPELPAETTNEETLDSTGAPKTSFASGETVLVSAAVSNVGTESQSMLIVVQLKDPDYRVLAPSYISVTLEPGQSLTPSIGFVLPMTGYTTGTWTAKVMVLDNWPALGGVTIGEPKTITFTVTS